MNDKIATKDLVGAFEISNRLGMSHHAIVHVWRSRYADFPKPVLVLHAGMIWNWKEVEAWARKTKRLK
jgi:predicted DNA-binding transcriptional regulator AlpA